MELIELPLNIPGFRRFFGSWVCRGGLNIVVDAGPANSARHLIDALAAAGLEKVDYVLLTHLHIDHAGGVAALLDRYPMARVICHAGGAAFLKEPRKLWEGSLKVLGKIAQAYGPPQPVAAERIIPHTENPLPELRVIETPGHAAHHLSFVYRNKLFAGEAAGNYIKIGRREYLRPATPPRFFLDVCLQSADRLLALKDRPVCFAHFGSADSSHRLLAAFRDQLQRWKTVIRTETLQGEENLIGRCIEALFAEDPRLQAIRQADPATLERERFFIANSVKGFIGYLRQG
jgi:glyoxylase-like metal-dependent hydrolase (beta-lactamase superfamily II)